MYVCMQADVEDYANYNIIFIGSDAMVGSSRSAFLQVESQQLHRRSNIGSSRISPPMVWSFDTWVSEPMVSFNLETSGNIVETQ